MESSYTQDESRVTRDSKNIQPLALTTTKNGQDRKNESQTPQGKKSTKKLPCWGPRKTSTKKKARLHLHDQSKAKKDHGVPDKRCSVATPSLTKWRGRMNKAARPSRLLVQKGIEERNRCLLKRSKVSKVVLGGKWHGGIHWRRGGRSVGCTSRTTVIL